MTFPRKVGLILLLVAVAAVAAHSQGLALPSLRWFFSFGATLPQIQEAGDHLADLEKSKAGGIATTWAVVIFWIRQHQDLLIGGTLCGILALAGAAMLVLGGNFHWNPLTVRKFARFRSIGRGWLAFRVLMLLIVLALLDQVLVGKRALAVKYEGKWHFPAFRTEVFYETDFGGSDKQEANYRKLKQRFAAEKAGNKVILPPIPWDPTFDSDEVLRLPLVSNEGVIFRPGDRRPFDGQAVQFDPADPEVQRIVSSFRKGLREGPSTINDENGEFIGRQKWRGGELEEESVSGDPPAAEDTAWVQLIYPPAPPSWKDAHFLGTDSKGWDIAAQLYGGFQVIMKGAVLFIALTYGIGIVIGCAGGYYGGWFDLLSQRVIEVISNLPFLLVVMIISANIGRENVTLAKILMIFCIFSWIGVALYLRTSTFREKARDYVAAARVQGAGTFRVIFRHILPNALSTIVTLLPFSVASLATMLTALDFLGFGLPETYPSWGRILDDGTSNTSSPWIVASVFSVMVGVLLLITFIGEAIREAFDPKKFTTYQ
jgi:microcin C transport system permease protein